MKKRIDRMWTIFLITATAFAPAPSLADEARVHLPTFASLCTHEPVKGFDKMLLQAATSYKVDPMILAVTVYRESGCDPNAIGSSGEIGLGQINPRVWSSELKAQGIIKTKNDLKDARINLRASAYVLAKMLRASKGDTRSMFRRYNGSGPKARAYAQAQVKALSVLRKQIP